MEFKSLKNIETSFRQIRLFGIVFLCLCALVSVFSVVASFRFAEKQREKIYVLDGGKSLMLALSQDLSQNRPVEAREHIRRFHELFFTLSPDRAAIESNINRALFLVDKSAFAYYQDMQEKGYYNRVVSGNISQRIEVDSVVCDFNAYPYRAMTYILPDAAAFQCTCLPRRSPDSQGRLGGAGLDWSGPPYEGWWTRKSPRRPRRPLSG